MIRKLILCLVGFVVLCAVSFWCAWREK